MATSRRCAGSTSRSSAARSSPSSAPTAPGRRPRSRSSRATASAARVRCRVLGDGPRARPTREWRERIGIVLQQCRMQPELTVRETVEQYAGYYRSPRPVDETIELVGLERQGGRARGQAVGRPAAPPRRRAGADRRPRAALPRRADDRIRPTARRQAWDVISSLRELGKTVFLTTHYMEEAQELADRAAIIVARAGSSPRARPDELGERAGADTRGPLPAARRRRRRPTCPGRARRGPGPTTGS